MQSLQKTNSESNLLQSLHSTKSVTPNETGKRSQERNRKHEFSLQLGRILFNSMEEKKLYLLEKCKEDRKRIGTSVNSLKLKELEKFRQRIELVQKKQQEKSQKLLERMTRKQIESSLRKEEEAKERQKMIRTESIKEIFVERRRKKDIQQELEKYNKTMPDLQRDITLQMMPTIAEIQESNVFNLTSSANAVGAITSNVQLQDSTIFNVAASDSQHQSRANIKGEYCVVPRRTKKVRKGAREAGENPFENKELWDEVRARISSGETNITLPGIGMQKTPIYLMALREQQRNLRKDDLRKRVQRGEYLGLKQEHLHFDKIYQGVRQVFQRVSDNPAELLADQKQADQSILTRKLNKVIQAARQIWGDSFGQPRTQPDSSGLASITEQPPNLASLDQSLEKLIEENSQLQQQKRTQNYVFTKGSHIKVSLN